MSQKDVVRTIEYSLMVIHISNFAICELAFSATKLFDFERYAANFDKLYPRIIKIKLALNFHFLIFFAYFQCCNAIWFQKILIIFYYNFSTDR